MVKVILESKKSREKISKSLEAERKRKEKKVDKKRRELMKKLGRLSRKKVQSKRTFKKSKTTLHLKELESQSVLGDPNRFFKDEMEEAKNALFLR